MQSTLSRPGGVMESICITDNALLLAAISYRDKGNGKPACYSVLNAFHIEGVC